MSDRLSPAEITTMGAQLRTLQPRDDGELRLRGDFLRVLDRLDALEGERDDAIKRLGKSIDRNAALRGALEDAVALLGQYEADGSVTVPRDRLLIYRAALHPEGEPDDA